MTEAQDIYEMARTMGYIIATPQKTPTPNFYKLGDGTILGILYKVNHLLQDPSDPNKMAVNADANTCAFVSEKNRDPFGKKPSAENVAPTIIDDDLQYEDLLVKTDIYDLSNGKIMSVKLIVTQISKTDMYTEVGEPIYNAESTPIIKFKDKPS